MTARHVLRSRSATDAGSPDRPNEDALAATTHIVVVADGATSRTDTGCRHGVAWYAHRLVNEIARLGPRPVDALSHAIARVADMHQEMCDLTHPGTPSAAVGVVALDGDTLRYLALADVIVAIETLDDLIVVCDDRIEHTARAERQRARMLPESSPEKALALTTMWRAVLAGRNVQGGYWVAAHDPSAAHHAITGEIPAAQVHRIAILTDGAARTVELFGVDTWPQAIQRLDSAGPERLIRRVRAVEASDPHCERWPRNKAFDDATAVVLTIETVEMGRPDGDTALL